MHAVALLLAAAAAGYAAARLLRLPPIPCLLLAGVALARLAPPPAGVLEDALVLGVAFLLFVGGLELDPRRMRAQKNAAMRVGFVQFTVLAVLGYAAARALGFGALESTYLAMALTASSTLINVRLLQRRQQMFEPFGRLVLGVLLLQDVLVILAVPIFAHLGGGWSGIATGLAAVTLLAGAALLVRRHVAPLFLRVADDAEALLLGSLAILFVFLGLTTVLALPLVVGAFLAGMACSRFPVNGVLRIELAPVGDFFTALFFTALGALVSLPTSTQLMHAAILGLLVIVVTVPLVTVLAERAGFSAKSSIEAGLLLSQTSEISLVVGLAGMLQGHIGNDVFTVIALVTLGTMLLTPFLSTDAVAWRLMHLHPSRFRSRTRPAARGHVLLLGAGTTAQPLLEDLVIAGTDLVVVDDDPVVLSGLEAAGVRTVRGDASDPMVLQRAGARRARAICSTIRRPRDNAHLLEIARDLPVLIRVFDDEDAEWVSARGGTAVLASKAAADAFLRWYEENEVWLDERLEGRAEEDESAEAA